MKVLSVVTDDFDFKSPSISEVRLLKLLNADSRHALKQHIKWTRFVMLSD